MQIIQNRRHFLAGITAISAVGLAGGRNAYAEDAPTRYDYSPLHPCPVAPATHLFTSLRNCCAPTALPTSPMWDVERGRKHADEIGKRRSRYRVRICERIRNRQSMPAHRSRCWAACMPVATNCSPGKACTSVLGLKGKRIGCRAKI